MPGRLVIGPELVARDRSRPLGKQGLHHLAGELQLLLHLTLLEQRLVKLGVLNGHADLAGDGGQKIEIVLLEPSAAVARVDLDDADGFALLVEERHAHERANLAVGDAGAVGKFGREVLAEDRLAAVHDAIEHRLADLELARGPGSRPDDLRQQRPGGRVIAAGRNPRSALGKISNSELKIRSSTSLRLSVPPSSWPISRKAPELDLGLDHREVLVALIEDVDRREDRRLLVALLDLNQAAAEGEQQLADLDACCRP